MSQACPLLFRQVDSTISKISTSIILAGIVLYFMTMYVVILFFIAADFGIRLSGYKVFSPIYLAALGMQKIFDLPIRMEDAGAKRLAAFFGLAFTVGIVLTHFVQWTAASYVIAVVFALCAIPEILFGYCIACKFYTLLQKVFPKRFA